MISTFFAQAGSSNAVEVLQDALLLSEETRESWQKTWDFSLVADPTTLWAASVNFAFGIAAFGMLYLALREGNDVLKQQSWGKLVEMVTWPFIVVFMLGNNGFMLSEVVLALRGVGQSLLDDILKTSLGGVKMQTAIQNVNLNAITIARIRQVYADCDGAVGAQLTTCFDNAQAEAQGMIDSAKAGFEGFDAIAATNFLNNALDLVPLDPLAKAAIKVGNEVAVDAVSNGIDSAFATMLQKPFLPLIEAILYTLQWVAVNLSEAALIMTALFAPIALAMSLMPIAGRMIFAWLAGFIGILSYQLGYNILVGLIAFVIINMKGTAETLNGLGFLFFSALGAPWIAFQIGQGGGIALYQGLSRRAAAIADGVADAVKLVARAAIAVI
jgi:hypothetical protein